MLKDLTDSQRRLAEYMSELSERAYSAGWMDDLEFMLWKGMNGEIKNYGRLEFTEEIINELLSLSSDANGWIVYDDETYISIKNWKKKMTSR